MQRWESRKPRGCGGHAMRHGCQGQRSIASGSSSCPSVSAGWRLTSSDPIPGRRGRQRAADRPLLAMAKRRAPSDRGQKQKQQATILKPAETKNRHRMERGQGKRKQRVEKRHLDSKQAASSMGPACPGCWGSSLRVLGQTAWACSGLGFEVQWVGLVFSPQKSQYLAAWGLIVGGSSGAPGTAQAGWACPG